MSYRTDDAAREAIVKHVMDAVARENFTELRIALLTRDAGDTLAHHIVRSFAERLKKELQALEPDMRWLDHKFSSGEKEGRLCWHDPSSPACPDIELQFEKPLFGNLFGGISIPASVGKNGALEDVREKIKNSVSGNSVFAGRYHKDWLCWNWMPEPLKNANSTEALLILAGAEKLHGRDVVDYIADEFVKIRKAVWPILKG